MKAFTPAFALCFALAACGGATPAPSEPAAAGGDDAHHAMPSTPTPAPAAAVYKAPGEAKPGDKSTCLISNEEFLVTETSPKVEHEGKTYYFCCPGCDTKFQADPAKYLKTTGS